MTSQDHYLEDTGHSGVRNLDIITIEDYYLEDNGLPDYYLGDNCRLGILMTSQDHYLDDNCHSGSLSRI